MNGQRTGLRSATARAPRTVSTTAGGSGVADPEAADRVVFPSLVFPSLLERRRRVDQALLAVVMEAYVHGVSTCKVDDLVKALGVDTGISKVSIPELTAA